MEKTATHPRLQFPLAWVHGQRALSLRKAGQVEVAVLACDKTIELFSGIDSDDLRFEVAWIMNEKAICLRKMKRLKASIEVARSVPERFASSEDPRIKAQCTWALHIEAAATLVEAKLFLSNGFREDAEQRLRAVCELYSRAATEQSSEPDHLQCLGYAEYLLGNLEISETTLERAFALSKSGPLDTETICGLLTLQVPEDESFLSMLKRVALPHGK